MFLLVLLLCSFNFRQHLAVGRMRTGLESVLPVVYGKGSEVSGDRSIDRWLLLDAFLT